MGRIKQGFLIVGAGALIGAGAAVAVVPHSIIGDGHHAVAAAPHSIIGDGHHATLASTPKMYYAVVPGMYYA